MDAYAVSALGLGLGLGLRLGSGSGLGLGIGLGYYGPTSYPHNDGGTSYLHVLRSTSWQSIPRHQYATVSKATASHNP